MGLKSRIKVAKSVDDINALLSEGRGYKYASGHTQRQWARVAEARIAELSKPKEEPKKKKRYHKTKKS